MTEERVVITSRDTLIGRAVRLDRYFSRLTAKLFFGLIWITGTAALIYLGVVIVLVFFGYAETEIYGPNIAGLVNVAVGLFLLYVAFRTYYKQHVCYPAIIKLEEALAKIKKGESFNLFSLFSFELAKASSSLFSQTGPEPNSAALAVALLQSKNMDFILVRLNLNRSDLIERLSRYQSSIAARKMMLSALQIAIFESHHQIEVGDVFVALCQNDPFLSQFIKSLKLDAQDIANVVYWQTSLIRKALAGHRFLDPARFHFSGGIGRDWAYGFTPLLNQAGRDLTRLAQIGIGLEVVGREKEIEEIEEALIRSKDGGVVLVGEAGIGKRTTVLGLAKKIAQGKIKNELAFKHLFEIDLPALLSGYTNEGDILSRLNQLFIEVIQAGNSLLFIENIDTLLAGTGTGRVDATSVLTSYLDVSGLRIIGSLSAASYHQYIEPNPALASRLTKVAVEESNEAQTIRILEDSVPFIEVKSNTIISYEAIKAAVQVANKYIVDIPNPEKSIDLLDGAAAHAASIRGKTIVTPSDISKYVEKKYDLPPSEIGQNEKQKLLTLETEMHRSVIGQDAAIKAIAGAMRRARAGVAESKKPIGSFLFLGPTGVGKTETAKALARSYFGSSERMVRFDMSEYQNREDIYRFIGSNSGGERIEGTLTTAVREHPFSLLLFDEIEKANPDILDLFLQVFDEGHLTDGSGRKVLFTNVIIICTSNAGANLIRESLKNNSGQPGSNQNLTLEKLLDYIQRQNIFRPEFLNRFSGIIVFSPLTRYNIAKIAQLLVAKVKETMAKTHNVKLEVEPDALAYLAEIGFDPEMGARPMQRVIEEKVENLLADKILNNSINEGEKVLITLADVKGG